MRRFAILLTAVLVVLTGPAFASEYVGEPRIDKPLQQMPNGKYGLAIDGGGWRIKDTARWIDQRVDGLRIFRVGGCEAHPAANCVTVEVQNVGDEVGWWGLTQWTGVFVGNTVEWRERSITFNSYYPRSQEVAAHELLHALGFPHHAKYGAVGIARLKYPSRAEMRVLRATYRTD